MILDKNLLFSDDQALGTLDDSTIIGTNVIDWEKTAGRQVGSGELVRVYFQVTTAFASGTTVQFQLRENDTNDLSSTPTTLVQTAAIAVADLSPLTSPEYGLFTLTIPANRIQLRYFGVAYVGVGTFSAGACTSGIVMDEQTQQNDNAVGSRFLQ